MNRRGDPNGGSGPLKVATFRHARQNRRNPLPRNDFRRRIATVPDRLTTTCPLLDQSKKRKEWHIHANRPKHYTPQPPATRPQSPQNRRMPVKTIEHTNKNPATAEQPTQARQRIPAKTISPTDIPPARDMLRQIPTTTTTLPCLCLPISRNDRSFAENRSLTPR